MEMHLISYLRDNHGTPVGCVIARHFPELDNNTVYIAGSLCRKKDRHNLSKSEALLLAEDRTRAMAFKGRLCPLPQSLAKLGYDMVHRAKKYFDGKVVQNPMIAVVPPQVTQE